MRVFLTGATGFVGSHLRRALTRDGHQVTALARTPPADEGDVTWVAGDIGDVEALTEGMAGCAAVIHLVGIIRERGTATFAGVHVQGTEHVLAALRRARVPRLLHMSALGAGPKQSTEYFRTKWAAEELVRAAAGIDYTILRPALIFGPGDGFISTLVEQLRRYPVLPIIGDGKYSFAPISIHAVTATFLQALALDGSTTAKTFELCGPETLTYTQILDLLAARLHLRKPRVHLPAGLMALLISLGHFIHLPLPITHDELTMLLQGSVCADLTAQQVFDLPRITLAEGIREYVR